MLEMQQQAADDESEVDSAASPYSIRSPYTSIDEDGESRFTGISYNDQPRPETRKAIQSYSTS